jgi:hypothetical protein
MEREMGGGSLYRTLCSCSLFQSKPRNVAAKRDFNRIDAEGQDPDVLERALGEFEGRAASVIRGIGECGDLPTDEELSYVINLMALLVVRNPKRRRAMNTARRHTARIIGDMLTSDRLLFEHHIARAKDEGFIRKDAAVSFEAMRKFIEDDQYSVEVSTGESLSLELGVFENTLDLLGSRYWSLVTAGTDGPDFVTCDHPVTVVFKDREMRGPAGYGLPRTEVSQYSSGPIGRTRESASATVQGQRRTGRGHQQPHSLPCGPPSLQQNRNSGGSAMRGEGNSGPVAV